MTQQLPLPLPDNLVDPNTGKASQAWSRWFQDVNRTIVTINDSLLGLAGSNTGINTGDQTITLSGAIAGTGTGPITTTYSGVNGVTTGGTGLATFTTAYAPICAGTTATGNLQIANSGQRVQVVFLPSKRYLLLQLIMFTLALKQPQRVPQSTLPA